jgi:phage shock protein E
MEGFLGEIGPKDKPLVVYCASGARSCQAAALLRMNGYADVTDVGGIGNMPAIGKN